MLYILYYIFYTDVIIIPCLQAAAIRLAVSALVIALLALILAAIAVFLVFKGGDFGTPGQRLLTPAATRVAGGYTTVNETG